MKPEKDLFERRQNPRYYPDRKNQPKVSFIFNNGEKISIEVVNISKGGLLGYTSSIEQFLEIDHQRIDVIEIIFPERQPFRCSGKLLRLQPTREENKCFCAVEFSLVGTDLNQNQVDVAQRIEESQQPEKKIIIPDQQLLKRVERATNYMRVEDADRESEIRKSVYDSFDDITSKLSLEEKWWFFEIIDEMKRREPDCPEGLKRAYIKLCRIGIEQSLGKHHKLEIAGVDHM
ncbi:MAG: hypothetical protein ACOY90_14095 [Candidatus Zhuqueibacterota bacterium]